MGMKTSGGAGSTCTSVLGAQCPSPESATGELGAASQWALFIFLAAYCFLKTKTLSLAAVILEGS